MILQRPTPSNLAAAAAVAAAALPAQAAGGDVAADAAARSTTETWQQYTASIPFYPVHHPCDTSCGGHARRRQPLCYLPQFLGKSRPKHTRVPRGHRQRIIRRAS